MTKDGEHHVSVTVEDIANGIAFLASDDARMINGIMMPIDNAWSTT